MTTGRINQIRRVTQTLSEDHVVADEGVDREVHAHSDAMHDLLEDESSVHCKANARLHHCPCGPVRWKATGTSAEFK